MRALIPALVILAAGLPASADPIESRGSIAEVTVYRGQALVTRAVPLPAPAGLAEVLVTDLPEHVVPASLFAESGGGVEVRSVRYRVRPVLTDVNEEVRKIDQRIRDLDDQLAAAAKHADLLKEHRAYLAKLEGFVAPTATVELTQGVLNAETLKTMTELLLTQRQSVAEEELKLGLAQRDLSQQRDLAQRERATLAGSSKTVREAVVLVNIPAAAGGKAPTLRVSYLVDQASWSPSYTIRANEGGKKVLVEYYAAIQQLSGEDWSDVAMTLSTATPSLVARAPELKPMAIALGLPPQTESRAAGQYLQLRKELGDKQRDMASERNKSSGPGEKRFDDTLNSLAGDVLMLDLLSNDRVVRTQTGIAAKPDEGLSVTYTLASHTSLPSRSDRQQIQIASISMPGEFYKVATPVLTSFVYDEASVVNESKLVLLAGPSATYAQGRFVGVGEVPTVSTGERFTVGFGIDSSLRASRELVERTETIQGGNRVVDLTYQLAIENFGDAPAKVRLMDRLPKARESEIKLTLVEAAGLSTDAADVLNQKKNGILRWEVAVPAGASGAAAKTLEYKFKLEHDKQMSISGLSG